MVTILPGHEDLKPKEIVGFTGDGHAIVMVGDTEMKYKMSVLPGGGAHFKPSGPVVPDIQEVKAG